jgi:RNA polymerase sigma factor (TIGR02999 family)
MSANEDVTQLLRDWAEGDEQALAKLTPLLYAELHRLAHRHMRRERASHTLQTTALINEVYLRLVDWNPVRWKNRAQFFAVSARLMRRILVDFARACATHGPRSPSVRFSAWRTIRSISSPRLRIM